MAEGLSDADFAAMRPAAERFASHPEWAREVMADIYRRHDFPDHVHPSSAAMLIEEAAKRHGAGMSAWANPQERARAREQYAAGGDSAGDMESRWQDSIYMLDPRTYEYMQKYGRDADFLRSVSDWADESQRYREKEIPDPDRQARDLSVFGQFFGGSDNPIGPREQQILDDYRLSKDSPLYRSSTRSANYSRFGGVAHGIVNATANPDTYAGTYFQASETVPNYIRMLNSGEVGHDKEAWEAARAQQLADSRYRLNSPAPIMDLPDGATPQQITARIRSLREELAAAAIPMAEERWHRTQGWTPPGFLADAGDFSISMLDPTALIPAAKGAGALTTAARAASKGYRIAGAGWAAPIVKKVVGGVSRDAAWDMGVEQAAGAGIQAAMGGNSARSTGQYWQGGGLPGQDFEYKSGHGGKGIPYHAVSIARSARKQLLDRLQADDGVSRADQAAYARSVLPERHALMPEADRPRKPDDPIGYEALPPSRRYGKYLVPE